MRKKEILKSAALLASELSTVGEGSLARMRDGSTVEVSRYAHGAAAALGLLVLYAEGGGERPTIGQVISVALDWHEDHTRSMAEHPEEVTIKTIGLRGKEADHE